MLDMPDIVYMLFHPAKGLTLKSGRTIQGLGRFYGKDLPCLGAAMDQILQDKGLFIEMYRLPIFQFLVIPEELLIQLVKSLEFKGFSILSKIIVCIEQGMKSHLGKGIITVTLIPVIIRTKYNTLL